MKLAPIDVRKREKSGKRKRQPAQQDHGTLERQLQYARALRWRVKRVDGNRLRFDPPSGMSERDAPILAQTALGIAYGRRLITKEMWQAGCRYQAASWQAYGKPYASAFDPGDWIPAEYEGDIDGARKFIAKCDEVLKRRGRSIYDAARYLCRYDRFSKKKILRASDGLEALADFLGYGE